MPNGTDNTNPLFVLAALLPLAAAAVAANRLADADKARAATRFRHTATATFDTGELTEEEQGFLDEHNPFGIPQSSLPGSRTLIVREGYTLAHNNVDRIADWVSFRLTKEFANGTETRPGSSAFKPDPRLSAVLRAEKSDYQGWKNILDRGHQVASGDSKGRGTTVIKESFFLSNMTPQSASFNRGDWRSLEMKIQQWARDRDEVFVVTGPVFQDDDADGVMEYGVIGKRQVAIPTHYFKIVLDGDGGEDTEAIAFLVENKKMEDEFDDALVSIDEIERLTGLDFFPSLEDSVEDEIEESEEDELWDQP